MKNNFKFLYPKKLNYWILKVIFLNVTPLVFSSISYSQNLNWDIPVTFQSTQLSKYLNTVEQILPVKMVNILKKKTLKLEFKKVNYEEFGSTNKVDKIILDQFIFQTLFDSNLQNLDLDKWRMLRSQYYKVETLSENNTHIIRAKHDSVKKLILSVLIHELTHIYDFMNVFYSEYYSTRKNCIMSIAATGFSGTSSIDPTCKNILSKKTSLSTLPEYLELAEWPDRGFLFVDSEPINTKFETSPYPYEYSSTIESIAVNMEYFLLDHEFKCRRPQLFNFLKKYFNHHPFGLNSNSNCKLINKIIISKDSFLKNNKIENLDQIFSTAVIDPKRIYQIHYLYAGKNDELSSKWGHSMFRLIICAPSRAEIGPDCLKDRDFHIVASFGAIIGANDMNYFDALVGNYNSSLFFYNFSDVLKNYTEDELRELYSAPLNLSLAQKESFVYALLEAHWSYVGKYKFTSNNCAIEAFSIIKKTFINIPFVFDSYIRSPSGLLDKLEELKIIDQNLFLDKAIATKNGFYFISQQLKYDKILQIFNENKIVDDDYSLNDFIDSTPDEQLLLAEKINTLQALESFEKLKLGFYLLSNLAYSKFSKSVIEEIVIGLDPKNLSTQNPEIRNFQTLSELFKVPTIISKINSRYGLPIEDELTYGVKQLQSEFKSSDLETFKKHFYQFLNEKITPANKSKNDKFFRNLKFFKN